MDGLKIKRLRGELGLTQKDFAKILSVTSQTVGNWEKGRVKIPVSKLLLIEAFSKNPKQFLENAKSVEQYNVVGDNIKVIGEDVQKEESKGCDENKANEKIGYLENLLEEKERTIRVLEEYIAVLKKQNIK